MSIQFQRLFNAVWKRIEDTCEDKACKLIYTEYLMRNPTHNFCDIETSEVGGIKKIAKATGHGDKRVAKCLKELEMKAKVLKVLKGHDGTGQLLRFKFDFPGAEEIVDINLQVRETVSKRL